MEKYFLQDSDGNVLYDGDDKAALGAAIVTAALSGKNWSLSITHPPPASVTTTGNITVS